MLDVKTGSGAFMREYDDAKKLAAALVRTGNGFGVKTEAVITDMNQPLGKYVGNSLEVYECVRILRGETNGSMKPTLELSVELSARMLVLCGVEKTVVVQSSKFVFVGIRRSVGKISADVETAGRKREVCDNPEFINKNLIEYE